MDVSSDDGFGAIIVDSDSDIDLTADPLGQTCLRPDAATDSPGYVGASTRVIFLSSSDSESATPLPRGPPSWGHILPSDGATAEQEVLAELASSDRPPWVRAVVAVFGECALGTHGAMGRPMSKLHSRAALRVVHDCRGIDGIGEALRSLHIAGVLLNPPVLVASSERNPAAKAWCKMFHTWPAIDYDDMCDRNRVPTPSSDLYCCGFPCQPFSTRRGDASGTFDEANAQPFFAVLREVAAGKHVAVVLENVQGLLIKRYKEERCIDVVMRLLREAAGGRYFVHLATHVSPDDFGEVAHRPRVIIRMLLTSASLVATEEEFCAALTSADRLMKQAASSFCTAVPNALCMLQHAGLGPGASRLKRRPCVEMASGGSRRCSSSAESVLEPEADSVLELSGCTGRGASAGASDVRHPDPDPYCNCCRPIHLGRPRTACATHACRCRHCRGGGPAGSCRWAARHAAAWAKVAVPSAKLLQHDILMDRPYRSYFHDAARLGLPADRSVTSPRVRNMLELVAAELHSRGVDPCQSDAVLDVSQSYGRHALRLDGLLPTIATTAQIFVMKWGALLQPAALFAVMGFPMAVYRRGMTNFASAELARMVGNTMHPGMVGPMIAALLSVTRCDSCERDECE